MGFFKFLKKAKEDKLKVPLDEELDIPPPPPIPSKGQFTLFQDMDKQSPLNDENFPLFPDIPENMTESPTEISKDIFIPKLPLAPNPILPPINKEWKKTIPEKKAIKPEIHNVTVHKNTFIHIDKFRQVRQDLNNIRGELKKSNESLIRIHHKKELIEKMSNKWQQNLKDMEKCLMFIDKAIKGDKYE